MSERHADVIVNTIKANMIKRMELNDDIMAAKETVRQQEAKLFELDNQQRLLETNLKRALIQEIEEESGEHVQAA